MHTDRSLHSARISFDIRYKIIIIIIIITTTTTTIIIIIIA